jgi:hypothetical protein
MISESRIGRKLTWPNTKELTRHSTDRTEENHEKPQGSRSLGRNLNPGPPEYEAGVLTTRPRRSVSGYDMYYLFSGCEVEIFRSAHRPPELQSPRSK